MPAIKYVKVQSLPRVDDPLLNRAFHTIDGELGKIARVLNDINSDNIIDAEITLDHILDGTSYGRIVLSALSEGYALLSEAVGDLDDISDGTYAKMLATSLSEGKALLSEALGSLDNIANGETYGRILLADLSGGHILLATTDGDLDDIDDGSSYGKILLTDISAGHILLASVDGDLDDVDNGANYGKVLVTSLSAGKILLTEAEGDLDDISEGTNYGKVAITDISAGHILLVACDGDLDDIDDGTYGKVLSTDISSGHIKLTEAVGDLDDIANGATYGRVALTDISAGHILLASVDGDLDDVDDGTSYGKILATDISAGHILLAAADGDLDDIAEGTNYGKVAITSIDAGKIVVAGLDADVTIRMFTDETASNNIEAWQHGVDATVIDGGKIYAASILAAQIAANAITADKINVGDFIYLPSDEDLVGYWSLDEGSGTLAIDGSRNGNNGTLTNMAEGDWVAGVVGTGLDFDGDNDFVDCGNASPIDDIGNGDFSVSFWMKSGASIMSYGGLFGKIVGGDQNNRIALNSNGTNNRLRLALKSGGAGMVGDFSASSDVFDESLHHIVLVINRTTDKALLYVDSVKDSVEKDISTAPADCSNAANLHIGKWSSYEYLGLIDEFRVYNRVLTASEIKALYLYPAGNKGVKFSGVQITPDTILLSNVAGDLDDIDDGGSYGKILLTDISAGHILLAACDGDLDDIDDGSSYGKVALTSITAGKIIVAGLDSGVTARMFTDETASDNIEAWQHGDDVTMIDGGKIYADTITANEIFANTITIGEVKLGTILLEMFTDFWSATYDTNDPWVGAAFGGHIAAVAGTPNHCGIIRLSADATNAGSRFLTATNCILIAGDEHSEFVFRPSTILANLRVRLGFQDSLTATLPTDGVYIDIGTAGLALLTGKTRNNGSGSTTGTSYAISNGTWYRAKIAVNSDATLITFTLYSEAGSELWSQTLAANIPTAAGRETGHGVVMFVAANVARSFDLDMMMMTFAGDLTR